MCVCVCALSLHMAVSVLFTHTYIHRCVHAYTSCSVFTYKYYYCYTFGYFYILACMYTHIHAYTHAFPLSSHLSQKQTFPYARASRLCAHIHLIGIHCTGFLSANACIHSSSGCVLCISTYIYKCIYLVLSRYMYTCSYGVCIPASWHPHVCTYIRCMYATTSYSFFSSSLEKSGLPHMYTFSNKS